MLSARKLVAIFFVVLAAWLSPVSAWANTSHHHVGGGSSGGGTDDDCLRWGLVTEDGAASDGQAADSSANQTTDASDNADGGSADASLRSDGGLVCLERAALFRCDLAGTGGAVTRASWLVSALVLVSALSRRGKGRRREARE